jgi:hypothetical protein
LTARKASEKRKGTGNMVVGISVDTYARRCFSVHDVRLGQRLIAKHCEYEDITKNWFRQEAIDCKLAFEKSNSAGNDWWIYAATLGVLEVALGYHFFALVGAIAGVVVAFFQGRYLENDAKPRRDSAVAP